MNSLLYLEINLFAMVILALFLINLKKNTTMMQDERLFKALLHSVFLVLVCDTGGWMLEHQLFPGARELLIFFDTLYFFMTGIVTFCWLRYMDYKLFSDSAGMAKRTRFYLLSLVVLSVLALATPWTGWLFYIGEGNVYCRGSLFLLHTLLSWAIPLFSCVLAFIKTWREQLASKKVEYSMIGFFSLIPLSGGFLQIFFTYLPLLWIFCTVSLLIIFINIQNRQISLDGLTGVNNRRTLNRYLETQFSALKEGEALFMLLIDIDDFKSINDTFGHAMGDTALIQVAEMLKKLCGRNNYFLARYGGDEFAIICARPDREIADDIIAQIKLEAKRLNTPPKHPYRLSLSAGYSSLRLGDPRGIEGLIRDADQWMYLHKRGDKRPSPLADKRGTQA